MCFVCDRIKMINEGQNPYFVKELETGYVVIGDNQHFKGYTLFLCKEHKTELFQLDKLLKMKFLEEMSIVAEAVSKAFGAEKMNYELLGNGDTHLHWHLFPRKSGDIENYGNNGTLPWKLFPDHRNLVGSSCALSIYFCHGTYLMAYLSVGLLS